MFGIETRPIEDHATEPKVNKNPRMSKTFVPASSLDVFTKDRGSRVAKRQVTCSPAEGMEERLQRKVEPFWQLAPDGETIERTYNPEKEPLIV